MEQDFTNIPHKALKEVFAKMEVNDSMLFPIERVSSVRSAASLAGITMDRMYRTVTNRKDRTISVIRVS